MGPGYLVDRELSSILGGDGGASYANISQGPLTGSSEDWLGPFASVWHL